jgi:hypothetical protein
VQVREHHFDENGVKARTVSLDREAVEVAEAETGREGEMELVDDLSDSMLG